MKILNILFESSEVQQKKVSQIEKENIESLKETQKEIYTMLKDVLPEKTPQKTVQNPFDNRFPIDHRIVKKVS